MTRIRVLLAVTLLAVVAGVTLGAPLTAAGGPNACPDSNPPNMLAIVGGSSQTAQLGKGFQQNLQVALANSNGCPLTGSLAGISVDFVAPSSGASGTFVSSASNVAVVGTDAAGVAVAPPFTANNAAGAYTVHAQTDYGAVTLYLTNTAHGIARSVGAAGPTEQSATVLSRYPEPLRATVLDADGEPVQGASVAFSLGSGTYGAGATFLGGSLQATGLTDSSGRATSPPLIANGVAGPFAAIASAEGVSEPVGYSLHNVAARSTIAPTRTTQSATVSGSYRRPLQARVLGGDGRPVEGASVTFALGSSAGGAGATFAGGGTQAIELTDASGLATSPRLRAGSTAGRFTATATTAGVTMPVSFSLENVAGKPASLVAGVAATESAPVASRFPIRLAVTATDANNNPVRGARVTFTAPSRGPSGHFGKHGARTARATTNAAGIAVAPTFTADRVPGGYVVTASVGGTRQAAAFALVNERR
jgi:protocatechuate 3,4-dioxygenase beta subunit